MIDVQKGRQALSELVTRKFLNVEQSKSLLPLVEAGKSFADFCIDEFGPQNAGRYLAEEFMEHLTLRKKKLILDKMSLPEYLLEETTQDWHTKARFILSGGIWVAEEAAEPWHPSLKRLRTPSVEVATWFNYHPELYERGIGILASMMPQETK